MTAQNDCSDNVSENQFAMISPGDLEPNDYNPNHMSDEGFEELVAEIKPGPAVCGRLTRIM